MSAFEQHYTPNELAEKWHYSPKQIRRLFRGTPGVLLLERPETRVKRSYATMRIPQSAAERVYASIVTR